MVFDVQGIKSYEFVYIVYKGRYNWKHFTIFAFENYITILEL